MNKRIIHIFIFVIKIYCLLAIEDNCLNVYMKIPYTEKLLFPYISFSTVDSPLQCLQLCTDHPTCKSVGIQTTTMTCYIYEDRVYAGLSGTIAVDMIYYWLLEAECPISLGYTEDKDTKLCTKYHSTGLEWSDAQNECKKDGGHLIMLDTHQKKDVLFNNYGELRQTMFVGSTDVNEEGVWNWLNGVPVNMSDFRQGEPNNQENLQHCATWSENSITVKLDDVKCTTQFRYICEVPTKQAYGR